MSWYILNYFIENNQSIRNEQTIRTRTKLFDFLFQTNRLVPRNQCTLHVIQQYNHGYRVELKISQKLHIFSLSRPNLLCKDFPGFVELHSFS